MEVAPLGMPSGKIILYDITPDALGVIPRGDVTLMVCLPGKIGLTPIVRSPQDGCQARCRLPGPTLGGKSNLPQAVTETHRLPPSERQICVDVCGADCAGQNLGVLSRSLEMSVRGKISEPWAGCAGQSCPSGFALFSLISAQAGLLCFFDWRRASFGEL